MARAVTIEETRPRVLLLIGGLHTKQPGAAEALAAVLSAGELLDVHVTDDQGMLTPAGLAGFDVLVNYYTGPGLTEAQLGALLDFVAGGKGLAGIHNAADSFKNHPAYIAALGSRFRGHPPFGSVQVEITDQEHPITQGLTDFVVQDELYLLDHWPEGVHLLARASKDGEIQPSTYVKHFGAGRIFYCALGHNRQSHEAPVVGQLYRRGIQWAAGVTVTA
ncbi:MAG: ThuA domain-containing protein [Chloroflexi bacterium]|nr:ThuA domain-containing protein [Chloroflexota bacterium]